MEPLVIAYLFWVWTRHKSDKSYHGEKYLLEMPDSLILMHDLMDQGIFDRGLLKSMGVRTSTLHQFYTTERRNHPESYKFPRRIRMSRDELKAKHAADKQRIYEEALRRMELQVDKKQCADSVVNYFLHRKTT